MNVRRVTCIKCGEYFDMFRSHFCSEQGEITVGRNQAQPVEDTSAIEMKEHELTNALVGLDKLVEEFVNRTSVVRKSGQAGESFKESEEVPTSYRSPMWQYLDERIEQVHRIHSKVISALDELEI